MKVTLVNLKQIDQPYFDTIERTEDAAKDLTKFKILVKQRRQYGSMKSCPLTNYVVNGTWYLDHFGQLSNVLIDNYRQPFPEKLTKELQRIRNEHIVMDPEEFHQHIVNFGFTGSFGRTMGHGNYRLPSEKSRCKVCDIGWNMSNTHDCFAISGRNRTYEVEADVFTDLIGKPLEEVREMTFHAEGYEAILDWNWPVRNPRFIDLTIDPKDPSRPRNKDGTMSNHYSEEGMPWFIDPKLYVIQPGDVLQFNYDPLVHLECKKKNVTRSIRQEIFNAFRKGNESIVGCIEIPNGYTEEAYSGKWFIVQTENGMYRVGWRRHVLTLIPVETIGNEYSSCHIDQVKDSKDIHFNSYEDLTGYLKTGVLPG